MDFGNFLNQMGMQTGSNLALPNTEEIMQRHLKEQAPDPIPAPQPPRQSSPVEENPNVLKEDAVERVYEATAAIMKTIRKAFPNKMEQQLAYRSIYEAIAMTMTGTGEGPTWSVPVVRPNSISNSGRTYPTKPAPVMMETPEGLVENTNYIVPRANNLEGMTVDLHESYNEDEVYSRALDIKPNQGLTGVSQKDLDDLKVLAGIK